MIFVGDFILFSSKQMEFLVFHIAQRPKTSWTMAQEQRRKRLKPWLKLQMWRSSLTSISTSSTLVMITQSPASKDGKWIESFRKLFSHQSTTHSPPIYGVRLCRLSLSSNLNKNSWAKTQDRSTLLRIPQPDHNESNAWDEGVLFSLDLLSSSCYGLLTT